jgi:putative phosphoesterase
VIGIVSDIHGNIGALLRAFEIMGPVDEVLCLGDVITQNSFSNEVVALLKERQVLTIWGNHEETFFGESGAAARQQPHIEPLLMAWLEGQPKRRTIARNCKTILQVHSTPWRSDGDYVSRHHRHFPRFGETPADVVLCGHTHQPVVQQVGAVLVVNPGSVGQRCWNGAEPVFSFALLDPVRLQARIVEFTT